MSRLEGGNNVEERTLPKLRVRREAANQKIQARLEAGQLLRERKIDSSDELENVREDFRTWSEYSEKLLTRLFDKSSLANEYQEEHGPFEIYDYNTPLTFEIVDFRRDVTKNLKRLEGIREQLELFDEPLASLLHDVGKNGIAINPIRSLGNEIFIVYGQHEAAKHAVARFVERFNIEPQSYLTSNPTRVKPSLISLKEVLT